MTEPQLARQFQLEINTGTTAVPVWVHIGGITNISPSQDSTKTDDGHFDSGGRAKHSVVERGDSFQVDMLYLEDDAGVRDPGQQALLDISRQIGNAGKTEYRYIYPNGTDAVTFRASADMALPGGGKTDNANMSVTVTVDGDITDITI
jgi:hypothetical protein